MSDTPARPTGPHGPAETGLSAATVPVLVSGIHDLGKSELSGAFRRSFHSYRKALRGLLRTRFPLYLHADREMHAWINTCRHHAPTQLRPINDQMLKSHPWFEQIQRVRTSPGWQNQAGWLPHSPQASLPYYLPLVFSKIPWLAAAALAHPFGERNLFWIDAGILGHLPGRDAASIEHAVLKASATAGDRFFLLGYPYESATEIHGFDRSAMARLCGTDYVDRVCRAGLMGGSPAAIARFARLYDQILAETLSQGLMGTEENILTIASYREPSLFHIHMLPDGFVGPYFKPTGMRGLVRAKLHRLKTPIGATRRMARRTFSQLAQHRAGRLERRWTTQIRHASPHGTPPADGFDLHLLVCAGDVANALWSVRTFLHFSGLSPRLFWHDDGSLSADDRRVLCEQYPHATLIRRDEADGEMRTILKDHPAAHRYRFEAFHWPAIKLLDFAHYSASRPFMILDADVLFFQRPTELVTAIRSGRGFFMNDIQEAYVWPPERWPQVLGVPGLSRVNVGLMGVPAGHYDLTFIEHCLRIHQALSPTPRPQWLEQTVWGALLAQHSIEYTRLPASYGISTARAVDITSVAHHFTKDHTASRPNFTLKGLRLLHQRGEFEAMGVSP